MTPENFPSVKCPSREKWGTITPCRDAERNNTTCRDIFLIKYE
nr:MAG TPA: hypothetical protein [Bacteriophage sp.]